MDNKLFVGGIAWGTTDEALKAFFERVGEVSEAKIIIDRETGRSKGFGFVTMATPELAQKAIDELNGQELDSRALNINLARPQQPRENRGGSGRY